VKISQRQHYFISNQFVVFCNNYIENIISRVLIYYKMKTEKEKSSQENSDWLAQIRKIREYSSEQFDKLLVYLSSGALVLTLGFVKDIVKISDETDKSLLIASWSLYALSLLLILFSHKSSIISMDFELNKKSKKSDLFDIITEVLNWSSTISLLAGIITFIIFVYKNI